MPLISFPNFLSINTRYLAAKMNGTQPGTRPASEPHVNGQPAFDVYARPYVPQHLIQANHAPAQIITTPIPSAEEFSVLKHLESLFRPSRPQLPLPNLDGYHRPSLLRAQTLIPEFYENYFEIVLDTEYQAHIRELKTYDMYDVSLHLTWANQGFSTCELRIPGLRENSPAIAVGDVISLRQLMFIKANTPVVQGHVQYNAVVQGLSRTLELVQLGVVGLDLQSMRFNVMFQPNYRRFHDMRMAVALIQQSLTIPSRSPEPIEIPETIERTLPSSFETSEEKRPWMMRMLFPEPFDGEAQTMLNRANASRKLYDPALNFEQQKAVESVCNGDYGEVPFLISGPPGTGKTKTLVEITLQLVNGGASALLVCAPSEPAADTLAQRLRTQLGNAELLRLCAPSRTFAEVPGDLLPFCYIFNNGFAIPPLPQMMRYRVVVTTCRGASMLISSGLTNEDLFWMEHGLHSILHPNATPDRDAETDLGKSIDLHWSGLLIDEAAQATEPEAAISLAVVAPPRTTTSITKPPCFVMVGDHQQLGPRTSSRSIAIQTSLFERLFDYSIYKDHPLARSRHHGNRSQKVLTHDMLPILRPPFANLIRNYRSHPAILAVPSALFYHDTLIPEAHRFETDRLLKWNGWRGRRWPVLFSPNTGADEIEQDGGGWYNVSEAHKACDYALSLVNSGLIAQQDICIMSPFQAQVRLLRKLARSEPWGLWSVNIGPMEAFQGLESGAVIMCTTRTRTRFLEQDKERGFGIVNEPKRLNVALTRAMGGLVIIGSPEVLAIDEYWKTFLAFCRRNSLWDEERPITSWDIFSSPMVSVLEKGLVVREAQPLADHVVSPLEDDMWLSGMAAELSLAEEHDHEYGDQASTIDGSTDDANDEESETTP